MNLDFQDEALRECLNYIISALLPHKNYEPQNFSLLFPSLKQVVDTKAARGLYYLFYSIFDKYLAMAKTLPADKFQVRITRERFSSALENNLPDFIIEPQLDLPNLMAEEGKSADISIPTVHQEAMGVVYEKVMALYDLCFELEQSYEDAMSRIIDLKDIVKANLIETGLATQRLIMTTGTHIGRRYYRGAGGWLKYVQDLSRNIAELERTSEDDLECNSLDFVSALGQGATLLKSPLAGYGIPQLDDFTPMLRHRLAVFVAKENVGKTRVMIHLIARLIRNGVKPFFACGESPKELMFYNIVSSYIYQEYGMFFESQYLTGPGYESLSPEDQQIVNTAIARVAASGLVISNNLSYDTLSSKITHYYEKGCEAFFIDHTQSLRGRNGRPIGDLVTALALDCRELKNELPIYICVASHPGSELKELMQKDNLKNIQKSITAQSNALAQEADEVFILNETDYLRTQGLLSWTTYKRREAEKPPVFYIRKHFNVSAFEYDSKYQGANVVDEETLDGLIGSISGDFEDEEFDPELQIEF